MIYKGALSALIEREPRIVIEGVDPGRPELLVTFTPAARPRSISATLPAGKVFISSALTEATEVATSLLR